MSPNIGATLSLQAVSHSFLPGNEVLSSISLDFLPGQFVSLLGPSGCGKSTLLRLISGLDHPTSGSIRVTSPESEVSQSLVFQEATLMPWRTVLDNVIFPLELKRQPRSKSLERAREELARVGLGDCADLYPGQLSGGMKMRVSVARALVTRPSLLLLDEPFGSLDENTRHLLQEELRRIYESLRMTVIFVTHSASEAVFLSQRVIQFSKRPAHVIREIEIDLHPSRSSQVRDEAQFLQQLKRVRQS